MVAKELAIHLSSHPEPALCSIQRACFLAAEINAEGVCVCVCVSRPSMEDAEPWSAPLSLSPFILPYDFSLNRCEVMPFKN